MLNKEDTTKILEDFEKHIKHSSAILGSAHVSLYQCQALDADEPACAKAQTLVDTMTILVKKEAAAWAILKKRLEMLEEDK